MNNSRQYMIKLSLSYSRQKFLPNLISFPQCMKDLVAKESVDGGHEQPGCWFQCKLPCGTFWLGISVQQFPPELLSGQLKRILIHIKLQQIQSSYITEQTYVFSPSSPSTVYTTFGPQPVALH